MAVKISRVVEGSRAAKTQLAKAQKLLKAGRLNDAEQACRLLLDKNPEHVGALKTLGFVHVAAGNYQAALSCLVWVWMLDPKDWETQAKLGEVYLNLNGDGLSVEALERALALRPDSPDILFMLGRAYDRQQRDEQAVKCFEQVLELEPMRNDAAFMLGCAHDQLGDADSSVSAFERVLRKPDSPIQTLDVLYSLSQVPAGISSVDLFHAINELADINLANYPDALREYFLTRLAFTRAVALDRVGRHEEAWECLMEANRRQDLHLQNDRRTDAEFADEYLHTARKLKSDAVLEKTSAANGVISAFILGPSRSGKTTLERLVGTLNGCRRGCESAIVRRSAIYASQRAGLSSLDRPSLLPLDLLPEFASIYDGELKELAGDSRVYTVTSPGLIVDVGLLIENVPDTRFIFLKRNTDDLAFRIFSTHYLHDANPYAYDLPAIYRHLDWYDQLIDTWVEKFPEHCVLISYQDMVEHTQDVLGRIAQFCGVEAPASPPFTVGDDGGCAESYQALLREARG